MILDFPFPQITARHNLIISLLQYLATDKKIRVLKSVSHLPLYILKFYYHLEHKLFASE